MNTSAGAPVARDAQISAQPRRSGHPPGRRAPALLSIVLLAGWLAACGGGHPSASSLLDATFRSHRPIKSGRIELSFALAPGPPGAPSGRGPFALSLQGVFQSVGAGRFPHFALKVTLSTGAHGLSTGAVSLPGRLFLELNGVPFQAPVSSLRALEQSYAQASTGSTVASSLPTLGVEPAAWLVHPTLSGSVSLGGEAALHVLAGLDLTRFLADISKLSGAGATFTSGPQGAGLLPPARISALASSVRSAQVDLYTGARDHLLRRLALRAQVSTTPATRAALGGLREGTLAFVLQYTELNRPQSIPAPSNPRPLSELEGQLRRLGLSAGQPPG